MSIQSFFSCTDLEKIKIPSTVSYIDYSTFEQSSGNIEVADGNEKYDDTDGMLYNKTVTTIIHCPVSYVGNYTLPESVESVGQNAFMNCGELTGVIFPASLNCIDKYAFSNSGLTAVEIPSSLIFMCAIHCSRF